MNLKLLSELIHAFMWSKELYLSLPAPPTFESIMEDVDVSVGETPHFAVVVEGSPVPDILWFKVHDRKLCVCLHLCLDRRAHV